MRWVLLTCGYFFILSAFAALFGILEPPPNLVAFIAYGAFGLTMLERIDRPDRK